MLNNFIYSQTKDLFLEKLEAGQILNEAIVFIEETGEIWNRGNYFGSQTDFESLFGTIESTGGSEAILTISDANSNPEIPVDGDTDWIVGKRCLAKNTSDGVAICYLSDTDSTKFADGSNAALDGSMGEFMVHFPENYVTCEESNGVTTVTVSDYDGTATFREVLVGAVHATAIEGDTTALHSVVNGNPPATNATIVDFHNAAIANGTGWDIMDYETRNKITILAYAKYGTRDLQDIIGVGDENYGFIEGSTVSLGNSDGSTTNATGNISNSILGIENYFNNVADWLGGIHAYNNGNIITYYIYDGVDIANGIPSTSYRTLQLSTSLMGVNISKMKWGEYADLFPIVSDGDTEIFNTYYADGAFAAGNDLAADMASELPIVVVSVGGNVALPAGGGAIFGAVYGPSDAYPRCGARLQYRGNITIIDNPEEFKQL